MKKAQEAAEGGAPKPQVTYVGGGAPQKKKKPEQVNPLMAMMNANPKAKAKAGAKK